MANTDLPVWQLHGDILERLTNGNRLILAAPTGSGKSTQVPQMILDGANFRLPADQILVLQPRRVAARTLAARVAGERQESVGQSVGYQIRFENVTSPLTRIIFLTEGVLLRRLQEDPSLSGVGAIFFDEFHERNLFSDLGLGLVRQLQETTRPDLRLVVMSATLDTDAVAEYLRGPGTNQACPILVSDSRQHPVETRWLGSEGDLPMPEHAALAVRHILQAALPGDILVFMPGMAEINATLLAIGGLDSPEPLTLIPLHGDLPPDQQNRAFQPAPGRKVVVATNVAETSVTIDGIRHVVDGGQARIARFDAERGLNTLFVEPISQTSAEQRQGRAGRTAPGICWRLWAEADHAHRPPKITPEIQRSDLAEVVLLLHSLGISQAAEFRWLDQPDPAAVRAAEQLLGILGALRAEPSGWSITEIGRQMMRLPLHPRFSRMLVEAKARRCIPAAALCAALVSGRELFTRVSREEKHISEARELFEGGGESDFFKLIRAWQFARNHGFNLDRCRRHGVHAHTARAVEQTWHQILQLARDLVTPAELEQAENTPVSGGDEAIMRCLLAGFPDQVGRRRDTGTLECLVAGGIQATLARESAVQQAPLLVAGAIREVEGRYGRLTLITLATAIRREWLAEMFPANLSTATECGYDRSARRVIGQRLLRYLDLEIAREATTEIDPVAAGRALAQAYFEGYFELPQFTHEIRQFLVRVKLVRALMPELGFPDPDLAAVAACLSQALSGCITVKEAQARPLAEAFDALLPSGKAGWVNDLAPVSLPWFEGRTLKLQYREDQEDGEEVEAPEAQVKLTDCFGLRQHPAICEGQLPIKLWLTTPDGKRLEGTCDWFAFQKVTYPKLKPGLLKKFSQTAWP
jgi:ATP-dependent helicase HrpB